MNKLTGFYDPCEARKVAPVVSRPDLVAERNAQLLRPLPSHNTDPSVPASVTLGKIASRGVDPRIRCYRTDGTCYAILGPSEWTAMRKQGRLQKWLDKQNKSGVVIDAHGGR